MPRFTLSCAAKNAKCELEGIFCVHRRTTVCKQLSFAGKVTYANIK